MNQRSHSIIQPLSKKKFTHLLNLRKNRQYRKEHQQAVVLGEKLAYELLPFAKSVVVSSEDDIKSRFNTLPIYLTTQDTIRKIIGVKNPEPLLLEIDIPKNLTPKDPKKILILDKLSDPGNVGTLFRTALAFEFDLIILISPCTDPYNDKVIRASKGAVFSLPIEILSIEECLRYLKENQIYLLSAELKGKEISKLKEECKRPIALVLGNESHGVDPQFSLHSSPISIDMSSKVESLNVATAGSIIMHELRGPK